MQGLWALPAACPRAHGWGARACGARPGGAGLAQPHHPGGVGKSLGGWNIASLRFSINQFKSSLPHLYLI